MKKSLIIVSLLLAIPAIAQLEDGKSRIIVEKIQQLSKDVLVNRSALDDFIQHANQLLGILSHTVSQQQSIPSSVNNVADDVAKESDAVINDSSIQEQSALSKSVLSEDADKEKCGCNHHNPRADRDVAQAENGACDKCGCHYQRPKSE